MGKLFSITDAAKEIGVRPRDISDAFYQQKLDADKCTRFGRALAIPANYLPTIREVLKKKITV